MHSLRDENEHISFKQFQYLGFIVGGLAPVIVFLFLELRGREQNLIDNNYIISLFGFVVFGLFIALLAASLKKEHKVWFSLFFTIQAIYSFLLIHILVVYTGGPRSSVFALSYLYLPAIVGYSYGAGIKLIGASIILSISYAASLYNLEWNKEFFEGFATFLSDAYTVIPKGSEPNQSQGLHIYIIVFSTQLLVTVYIAMKSKDKK